MDERRRVFDRFPGHCALNLRRRQLPQPRIQTEELRVLRGESHDADRCRSSRERLHIFLGELQLLPLVLHAGICVCFWAGKIR